MEKIARYLILSVLGLILVLITATFVLDDETVESVAGPVATPLLSVKNSVVNVFGERADSFVYWVRTTALDLFNFSPADRTPRVVMRIPPPPELPEKPLPTAPTVSTSDSTATGVNEGESTGLLSVEQTLPPSDDSVAEPPSAMPPISADPLTTSEVPSMSISSTEADAEFVAEVKDLPTDPDPMTAMPRPEISDEAPAPPPMPATPVETAAISSLDAQDTGAAPEQQQSAAQDQAPPPPGDLEAQKPGEADYQEGLRFYSGEGVERNFGKAAQLFLKAADAGHVEAQFNLGIMNFIGQTGGQDFANAAKWFEEAASNGHAQAQYNLGFLYYEGKGVEQDLKTAFDWIARSADQGYPKAVKARDQFRQAMPEAFGS